MSGIFTFRVRVYRINREKDTEGRYQVYSVPIQQDDRVLDVLERIKETADPCLAFSRSCRHGICGSCAVTYNGKAVLACKTQALDAELIAKNGKGEITIEPVKKKDAVKDLIVDRSPFWEAYARIDPFLINSASKAVSSTSSTAGAVLRDEAVSEYAAKNRKAVSDFTSVGLLTAEGLENCIQCGICTSVCPVFDETSSFLGPAALVKLARFYQDGRDINAKRVIAANRPGGGVWECIKCMRCVDACPKGIDPYKQITLLHNALFKTGVQFDDARVRHAEGFRWLVKWTGILHEPLVALWSLRFGILRYLRRMMFMVLRGKALDIPGLLRSDKQKEIRNIMKEGGE